MLSSLSGNIISEYQFNYDYFLSQTVDVSNLIHNSYNTDRNKRLKLNSIQKTNEEKYSFSYNETLLPPKNSYALDYWGYSNGGYSNKTAHLNPIDFNYSISVPVTEINNNKKNSDIAFIKAGILEKITYPTKGYSKFFYELNQASNLFYQYNYYKYNTGNGVRLSEQKNYDFNNSPLGTTRYEYENGMTANPLHLLREDFAQMFFEIGDCAGRPVIKTQDANYVSMQSSSINNTFALSSGTGVGYSKVIRKDLDAGGNANGRTETLYSNNADTHYKVSGSFRPIFLPSVKGNKFENGTIMSISVFNNFSVKLREEKYNYTLKNSSFSYGVTMIHPMYQQYTVNQFGNNGDPLHNIAYKSAIGYYPIYSTETILSDIEFNEFVNGSELSTKTNYTYDNYNLITMKKVLFPSAEEIKEEFKYSHQTPRFFQANIMSTVTEKSVSKGSKIIFKQKDQYNDSNHFKPTSSHIYDLKSGFVGPSDLTYDKYDSKGNLLQYTKKGGSISTVIWGYNQTKPIAVVEGGTYPNPSDPKDTDIPQTLITSIVNASDTDGDELPNNNETPFLTKLAEFRKDPLTSQFNITTYTYDPLIGLRSKTSPSGKSEFYDYDLTTFKLNKILDQDNNILKEFNYKFASEIFYNVTRSQSFTRNNCGSGSIGGSYTYTVEQNKYSSYVSQTDADQKAQDDIATNGQNAANTNAACTPAPSCSLSFILPGGGSIDVFGSGYKITMSFSTGSNSTSLPWSTTGVTVARIIGNCKPLADYNGYNGRVYYTIKSNGDIIIKSQNGAFPNNYTISPPYELYFPFN